jgi:hypothetical protein
LAAIGASCNKKPQCCWSLPSEIRFAEVFAKKMNYFHAAKETAKPLEELDRLFQPSRKKD